MEKTAKHGKTMKMTSGNIAKQLLLFAVPMFLTTLLTQAYNLADAKLASDFLGNASYTAIGMTASGTGLFTSFAMNMVLGFTLTVSKKFGQGNKEEVKRAVKETYFLSFIACVIFTALQFSLYSALLRLLKTPEEIYVLAKKYLLVIIAGYPFVLFYLLSSDLLRAVGNSRVSLVILAISAVVNVVLDYLLLRFTTLAIIGTAIATIASQAVSALLCYLYIKFRLPELDFPKEKIKLDKKEMLSMVKIGISMGLMGSLIQIGSLSVQRPINMLGVNTMSAHISARKLDEILMWPGGSIGSAVTVFVSQNYGSKQYKRLREGMKTAAIINLCWCVFSTTVCYLFGEYFIRWIANTADPEIVLPAVKYLHVDVPCFLFLLPINVFRNALQGLGITSIPVITGACECLCKIIVSVFFAPKIGYDAIIFCEPIAWITMATASVLVFCHANKKIPKDNEPLPESDF